MRQHMRELSTWKNIPSYYKKKIDAWLNDQATSCTKAEIFEALIDGLQSDIDQLSENT